MKPLLVTSIIASVLGMFQYGFNVSCINPPQKHIETFIRFAIYDHYNVRMSQKMAQTIYSVTVVIFNVMGMAGALTGGALANKFGRKTMLQATALTGLLGSFALGSCKVACSFELFVLGRALVGLTSGLNTVLVPLALNEIAPLSLRGTIGTLNQLSISVGIFVGLALGLEDGGLGGDDNWPILIMFGSLPAALQFILQILNPESPSYLILQLKDLDAGRLALSQLMTHTKEETEKAVQKIQKENEAAVATSTASEAMTVLQLLSTPSLIMPNFLNFMIHFVPQISGIGAIYSYSTSFFRTGGVSCQLSQYSTLTIGATMVVITLAMVPLMEALGRRILFISGTVGMLISAVAITVSMNISHLKESTCSLPAAAAAAGIASGQEEAMPSSVPNWGHVLVAATIGFSVSFAVGPGPVPWIATGEIFCQKSKGAAMALGTFVRWSGSLLIVLVFPQIQANFKELTFVPSIVMLTLLLVTLLAFFPETKNKDHEQIAAELQRPLSLGLCKKTSVVADQVAVLTV